MGHYGFPCPRRNVGGEGKVDIVAVTHGKVAVKELSRPSVPWLPQKLPACWYGTV